MNHDVTTCDPPGMHLWIAPQVGDPCWCGQVEYDSTEARLWWYGALWAWLEREP